MNGFLKREILSLLFNSYFVALGNLTFASIPAQISISIYFGSFIISAFSTCWFIRQAYIKIKQMIQELIQKIVDYIEGDDDEYDEL